MRSIYAHYLICSSFFLSCYSGVAEAEIPVPETAIQAEQLALDARREIKTAEMRIQSTLEMLGRPEPLINVYQLSFDEGKFRVDSYSITETEAESKQLQKRIVYTPDLFIDFTPGLTKNGRNLAVRYLPNAKASSDQLLNRRMNVFDPRLIGVAPYSLSTLSAFSLDETLGSPDRTESSIEQVEYEGMPAWKVGYTRKDDIVVRLWIVPSMNYSVVRSEQDNIAVDGQFTDITTSKMQQTENGIWFPEEVNYKRIMKTGEYAGQTVEEETLTISDLKLNAPVNPDQFSLVSMDIPAGRNLFEYPPHPGGGRVWNGQKIIQAANQSPAVPAPPEESGNRWWFFISVNFALIAAGLVLYLFFNSKKNSPGS